jgi:hypothetical protein
MSFNFFLEIFDFKNESITKKNQKTQKNINFLDFRRKI